MRKNYLVEGSPVDYDELVVYIVINGKYVALVQQEEGKNKMIVEFLEDYKETAIYIDELLSALQEAKVLLSK